VRLVVAAWDRGDYGSAEWAHPEIEFVITDGGPPPTRTSTNSSSAARTARHYGRGPFSRAFERHARDADLPLAT
jgi:hypothetical protein